MENTNKEGKESERRTRGATKSGLVVEWIGPRGAKKEEVKSKASIKEGIDDEERDDRENRAAERGN